MKKVFLFFLFLLSILSLNGQNTKRITILHTNDLHSRLTGYSPESAYSPLTLNDDLTKGGFARISTIIKTEKEKYAEAVLVVDGGDFLMGTLFHGLESKTGFQLRLMKSMGYDVVGIGNHEFDFGPDKLAAIISQTSGNGEIPDLLLSNAVFSEKEGEDDSLEKCFIDGTVERKVILSRAGIKIGVFSLLGEEAEDNAAYAPPVTFSKPIKTARKIVKELLEEKCEIIICLSHSGLEADGKGGWKGEDVKLAENVKGIDIIISAHSHSLMGKPLIVNNIPIVQTGEYGQNVGKMSVEIVNGTISIDEYTLIPVDDKIPGDPPVHQLIEEQKRIVASEILEPLGMNYNSPVAETKFLLECDENGDFRESNLGPMVADAIHSYVNKYNRLGTDISMVAVGVIRDDIVPGFQTAPDIFRVMSMGTGKDNIPGYPLARLYVTGKELKSILEILQVAYKSAPENFCYYSGLKVDYDPGKGMLRKIQKIEIFNKDGTTSPVDISKKNKKLYSITANSYMLEFFGIIKKMSFGLINVVPKDYNGKRVENMKNAVIDMAEDKDGVQEGKEWLALISFLSTMKDTDGNQIPDIDKKYSGSVKSFFEVKK